MNESGLALVLAAASLALAVASLALAMASRRLQVRLRVAVPGLLFRAEVLQSEAVRLHRVEQQFADAQRLGEVVVSGGTQTVRAIHRGIAAIPFGILEAIPATRDATRIVRASHDLISDAVYGGVDAVNRGVGRGLRAGLRAGVPPARSEAAAPAPAAKPTALK